MKKIIFPLLVLLTLSVISCKKNDKSSPANNTPGSYTSLSSIYRQLAPKSKIVTVNADDGSSFYGNSGTRYIFPAGAFVKGDGTNVTGNIQIEVNEFLNKSDMLFSEILPVSNGLPLLSAGEIYVNATQGGQKIYLKPWTYLQANVPQFGVKRPGMNLFRGDVDTNSTNTSVNWRMLNDSSRGEVIYNGDTINIFSDSTGLCNADRFMTSPDYQAFTVTITGVTLTSSSNIDAFALYDNYDGLWPMRDYSGNVISEGHVPNIPVHFVVIAVVNGNFYAGMVGATPATGSNYTVNLTQTDPTTFKKQVDAL